MIQEEKAFLEKHKLLPLFKVRFKNEGKTKKAKAPLTNGNWRKEENQINTINDIGEYPSWGLVCGKTSGVMVLDIDGDISILDNLMKTAMLDKVDIDKIKSTLYIRTPNGGYHLYFNYSKGLKNKVNFFNSCDFRTDGGYVLAPYSVITNDEGVAVPYIPIEDKPIMDMPIKLFNFIKKHKINKSDENDDFIEMCEDSFNHLRGMIEGDGRNTALNEALFRHCKAHNIRDKISIRLIATAVNNTYFGEPEEGFLRTADSVYRSLNEESESYCPLWQYDNCYWKNGSKNSSMPVSNFIIEPIKYIECIDDPGKSVLDVLIVTQNGEKAQRQYKASDFDKVSDFDKATNEFKTYFTGTIQDLKHLKVFIYSKVEKTIKGVSCGGMYLLNNEWYFIDKEGCLDSQNNKTDNIVLIDNSDVISSNLIKAEAIEGEELKSISPYLLNFNTHNITASILGYAAGVFLKEKLRKIGIKYSHFFGSGEGGAGKSETLENIIIPLLGIENKPQSAVGCTKYAMEKKASSNNTIPYVIEEYKPKRIGEYKVNLISNMLRDLYDGHTSIRGSQDMSIHELELVSPVIIMGESSTSETANIERSLMITFSKTDSLKAERTAAYMILKNNPLLNKLGRSLLEKSLKLSIDDVKILYNGCLGQVSPEIKTPRVRNTVANTLLGLTILYNIYSDLGLSFENETDTTWSEVVECVNNNAIEEILENTSTTFSIIDKTFEVFNNMFGMQYCKEGDTYLCKLIDDDTLAMQISTIYTFFTKFIREYNIEGDWLSYGDFVKQLKKNDYCIAFNIAIRFLKKFASSDSVKDKQIKGLKISLSKMNKKGLNIDKIIDYANDSKLGEIF